MALLITKPKSTTLPEKPANKKYSGSPYLIGAVIKSIVIKKRISNQDLADALGISMGNINRLYQARIMPLPKLMKISELLQENLLLHYHPNVPPLPNPLLAELNAVKAQLKEQMELRTKMQQTAEENIRLKAQLEILERIMAKK